MRQRPGLRIFQKSLDLLFERGQVVAHGIPYQLAVKYVIAVDYSVSEADNPLVL